ncbi:ChaN family lipoprotein [Flammeovirga sp. MY04]|uniref:ChaN family lipoprotein n=1 Tax=Flammeovirga sp. MY04 TaxID=1191459 RepID=UPI0008063248|nr:ChaN family lipoprotein [Flammeovirga sp. MY04]ANQ51639.1 ChaN family lipoprotein [Flammeovirga sp. MY04]
MRFSLIFIITILLISCNSTPKENFRNPLLPKDYIIKKFQNHDIVLLGEDHGVKEHVEFIQDMIPHLYRNGIYQLGMEFGAYEMQEQLDELLIADEYDPQKTKDLFFFYNVGWAFLEYHELYHKVWEFNQTLTSQEKKFRIINLSYQFHWEKFDMNHQEASLKEVFHLGEIDSFRCEIVKDQVINKKEKALLLVGTPHAFSKFLHDASKPIENKNCPFVDTYLGHRLYDEIGDKVFTILFHQSFLGTKENNYKSVSPANGRLIEMIEKKHIGKIGFDVSRNIANLTDNSALSECQPHLKLGDVCDGYIFIAPLNELTGCTIDASYFSGKDYKTEVYPFIPDPNWHKPPETLEGYLGQIRRYVDLEERYGGIK